MTRIITGSHVRRVLRAGPVLEWLRSGFRVADNGIPPLRVRTDLPTPGSSATALLPGLLPDVPAYTVKVNAKFPGATPALRGLVCLHSTADGELLAVLDSAEITAWRTGLAAALGTDALARPDADTLAVIGAGAQAHRTLTGLAGLRTLRHLTVHDTDPARAADFLAHWRTALGCSGTVADSPQRAAAEAGIVLLATWSRRPLLDVGEVAAGSQVTTLGADEPGKVELSAALLRAARVVVDDVDLVTRHGALGNVGLDAAAVAATFTEVLTGVRPGRTADDEVTVYAPIGLPWQDLAVAWPVFDAAERDGVGVELDLLG